MSTPDGSLSAATRQASLERMAAGGLDVLIVGGGITGVGAALDAATRGLTVGLVEARDFASGASSKSSKLIHGGLRYLEMGDFGLVREALRERELLLHRLAPHLVSPVPFLWPLHGRAWERAYLGAGLALYDSIGGTRSVPRHRHLTRRRALEDNPGLAGNGLVGAVRFYDTAEDDARMVAVVARTAAAHGALIANRARVVELLRSGGRVVGAEVRDEETGGVLSIPARAVALAVGAWTDGVRASSGAEFDTQMRPSKGIHIVVPREAIPMSSGLLARTEKSVLFVIPTGAGWLIGDTDTPWRHSPDRVVASGADIDYVLAKTNEHLVTPLRREDVTGVFAGLRPLVGPADVVDTTRLSRRHVVEQPMPGLTTIAGGKYTTYRLMAADLIDAAARDVGPVPAVGHRPLAAARRRSVRGVSAPAGGARGSARSRDGRRAAAAEALRGPRRGAGRARCVAAPSSPLHSRAGPGTSRLRSSTRAPSRERFASRMSWSGVQGWRSRRLTAASGPHPRSPS